MDLRCHCCGKRFRSMIAEAKHRHNFPALCNKNSRTWKRLQEELARDKRASDEQEKEPQE